MAALSQLWYFSYRHHLSYNIRQWLLRLSGLKEQSVDSVVIPCFGIKYVEEATLSAHFAVQNISNLLEAVIVTDQPASEFTFSSDKIRIATVEPGSCPVPAYQRIWHSRIIKIMAPLKARGDVILMIDSDLMLLRDVVVNLGENIVLGTFRKGKMSFKIKGVDVSFPEMKWVRRPHLKTHLNGAFLVANRSTWDTLCPVWLKIFESLWGRAQCLDRPPTDQLPLAIALDQLKMESGDLGIWANWPVPKIIGGTKAKIPMEVIGAHAGHPLSEYHKLLENRDAELEFMHHLETRKLRYQAD